MRTDKGILQGKMRLSKSEFHHFELSASSSSSGELAFVLREIR
jgi:hypothetical protein